MILLLHAKRIAHDSGRGMALPGLYSGRFLFGAVRVRHDPPKKRKPLRQQRPSNQLPLKEQ